MVISGFMLITVEGKTNKVINELEKIPGVEIHHIEQEVKVILTLEAPSVDESYRIGEMFEKIDGIISVCLAYTHFEDDPEMDYKHPPVMRK